MKKETGHFRVFQTGEEAEKWGWEHYTELLSGKSKEEVRHLLYTYTGSWYKFYNKILRQDMLQNPERFPEYEQEIRQVPVIARELNRHSLPENIVVYRYVSFQYLKLCGGKTIPTKGMRFTDKAFVSTGLVKANLRKFAIEHCCPVLLEIKLPKGTPGVYVSFHEPGDCLDEQEFLLPPGCTFEVERVRFTQMRCSLKSWVDCRNLTAECLNKKKE